jgi:hypothetical protein
MKKILPPHQVNKSHSSVIRRKKRGKTFLKTSYRSYVLVASTLGKGICSRGNVREVHT